MKQIEVSGLSKSYLLRGRKRKTALRDISFSVSAGEMIGIIGRNGSGKSTLLKLLCGITAPDCGRAEVRGRIAALLELGAGFQPEYTGIENIYLNGIINGFTKKETEKRLPEILEFAGIGDYASQPVKTYSDGMFVRLAFAAAICCEPDILVVDEALAVGDIVFQTKCFKKIQEMKEKGITVIFVTHDADSVRRLCDRAIWLDRGKIKMDGDVSLVTSEYIQSAVWGEKEEREAEPTASAAAEKSQGYTVSEEMINRYGSHVGAVCGAICPSVWRMHQRITVKIKVKIPEEAEREKISLSLAVKNREGLDIMVLYADKISNDLPESREKIIEFSFENLLCRGYYFLAAGLERREKDSIFYYDYCEGIAEIQTVDTDNNFGLIHVQPEVKVYDQTKG